MAAKSLAVELALISDKFVSGLSKAQKSVDSFSKTVKVGLGALAGYFSTQAIISGLQSTATAFLEQERAINKMTMAMKNQGTFSEQALKGFEDFATEIQNTTTVADEAALSIMANLKSYGMMDAEIKRATKAAIDFATAKKEEGMTIVTASELIGKAYLGNTDRLKRYGISVNEASSASEKFASVLRQLEARFGGSAQSELDTYGGKIKQMANLWGESKEAIGKIVVEIGMNMIPMLTTMVGLIKDAAEYWARLGVPQNELVLEHMQNSKEELEASIKRYEELLKNPIGKTPKYIATIQAQLEIDKGKLKKEIESIQKLTESKVTITIGIKADPKDLSVATNVLNEKQQKIADDLKAKTMEATMTEFDFKRWALGEEVRKLIENSDNKKQIIDQATAYHVAKLKEIEEAERVFYLNITGMAMESLEKRTDMEEFMATKLKGTLEEMRQTRTETTTGMDEKTLKDREAILSRLFGAHDVYLAQREVQIQQEYDAAIESNKALLDLTENTANAMENNFSNFFFDVMQGNFENLGDAAKGMLNSIQRAIADFLAGEAVKQLFGTLDTSTGQREGGWLSALFKLGVAAVSAYSGGGGTGDWNAMAGSDYGAGSNWHSGGIVGAGGFRIPRLHAGLKADEYPAILQQGEEVIPRSEAGKKEQMSPVINMTIHAVDAASFTELASRNPQAILGPFMNALRKGGAVVDTLRMAVR